MKCKIIISVIICIIGIILFGKDINNNIRDYQVWQDTKKLISSGSISSVTISGMKSTALDFKDSTEFINFLKESKFRKSNWKKEGPTGYVCVVSMKDDSKFYLEYFGKDYYEVSIKGRQFIISNQNLKEYIGKYEQ